MKATFAEWATESREKAGLSQADLARKVKGILGTEVTRDVIWQLEHGRPANPKPDVVMAIAQSVGRPVTEALEALGYVLPASAHVAPIHPTLGNVLSDIPWPVQEKLSAAIPAFLDMARVLVTSITGEDSTDVDNKMVKRSTEEASPLDRLDVKAGAAGVKEQLTRGRRPSQATVPASGGDAK